MPFHLTDQSRREFLVTTTAGLVACSTGSLFANEHSIDEDIVYLLNDTHVGEKHPSNSKIPTNLRQVVSELVKRQQKPSAVLINGDLALYDGQPGDYRHFAKLIRPLQDAKISLHLTLGNHDNRQTFYDVMKEEQPENPVVKSRHISVVKTKFANFFLLDSLTKTMVTQGTLGDKQLDWLSKALDKHADKPAIIVTHHNPILGGDPKHFPGGLIDSKRLWKILASRKHVKVYIHGHIHHRSFAEHQGIHIVNTPAISYVRNPKKSTTGWTVAKLTANSMQLTTRTNDEKHQWNNNETLLKWRS